MIAYENRLSSGLTNTDTLPTYAILNLHNFRKTKYGDTIFEMCAKCCVPGLKPQWGRGGLGRLLG
jgi:hypothetical protein